MKKIHNSAIFVGIELIFLVELTYIAAMTCSVFLKTVFKGGGEFPKIYFSTYILLFFEIFEMLKIRDSHMIALVILRHFM